MSIFHDVTNYIHRSPIGALRCGDRVSIALYAPEENTTGGELVLYGDGFEKRLALSRHGAYLKVEFNAPQEPGVLWYHFFLQGFPYKFFCGADDDELCSVISNDWPQSFRLVVYSRDFETPAWFRGSVMYQIFPDRFSRDSSETAARGIEAHRKKGRKLRWHEDWEEKVCWDAAPGEKDYVPNDFYGGTLNGIRDKLPYLKSLGVGVLYLNPVFEADSNHRYNTADYMTIDPVLGTNEDFRQLCSAARSLGIRIMLDGVFSHTGSDSIYFNREGRYDSPGAYQGEHSPFFKWFNFYTHPDSYRSWWGFPTLPEVDETVAEWQEYIYSGDDAVAVHWLREGASGWRLDVADELPDETLRGIYTAARKEKPDSIILGEVWEDPTIKESYGKLRKYALGGMLDTVMNYPLREAIISFATGRSDAEKLMIFLMKQRVHYPQPMYFSLMNLLSSHDVPRLRTSLIADLLALHRDKAAQAAYSLTEEENARALVLQRLCAVIQFSLPGVPCIYYGDEHGMQGAYDPFDRAPFIELEPEMAEFYGRLASRRNESKALRTGGVGFFSPTQDVLCILRVSREETLLVTVNRGDGVFTADIHVPKDFRCLTAEECERLARKKISVAVSPKSWCLTAIQ